MKLMSLFFLLLATFAHAQERGNLKPPQDVLNYRGLNVALMNAFEEETDELKKVKYYLINGETRLAKLYLDKVTYGRSKLTPIFLRYHGIIAFIEGDFKTAFRYLNRPEINEIPHFSRICPLKILTEIVLNETELLDSDWRRCQHENRKKFNSISLTWLEVLVKLKLEAAPGVTKTPLKKMKLATLDTEEIKIVLKLALYLNQETMILPEVTSLEVEHLRDTDVRDLLGQIYYRTGNLKKAYHMVEELKSPNAENIKGNLYILRKKYELAYAQFKLALEQKQNSQNALERLVPLAWMLEDWEKGAEYAESLIATPETQMNKLALLAAFELRAGRFDKAKSLLTLINQKSRRGAHLDVTQLNSYVSIEKNDAEAIRKQSHFSCEQFDLINCWVQYQLYQWESFPLTMKRNDSVISKTSWEKLVNEEIDEPLKETVYINQLDIEEMDDNLIQLIKKTTP